MRKPLTILTLGLIGLSSLGLGVTIGRAEEPWQNALLEEERGEEYRFWTTGDGAGGYRRYGSWGGEEGVWKSLGGNQYQLQPTMPATRPPTNFSIYQVEDIVVMDKEGETHAEQYRILQKGGSWEEAAQSVINLSFGYPNFKAEVKLEKIAESDDKVSFNFEGRAKARGGFRMATWSELGLETELNGILHEAGIGPRTGPFHVGASEGPSFEYDAEGKGGTLRIPGEKRSYILAVADETKAAGFSIQGTGTAIRYGPGWTATADVRSAEFKGGFLQLQRWIDINDPIIVEAKRGYIERVRQKMGEKTRIPLIGSTWAANDGQGKLALKISLSWEPEPLGPNGAFLQALAANNGAQLEANAKTVEARERETAKFERRDFLGGRKVYGIVWQNGKPFPTVGFTKHDEHQMVVYLMAEGKGWFEIRYGYKSKEVRVGNNLGPCGQEPLQGLGGVIPSPAPTTGATPTALGGTAPSAPPSQPTVVATAPASAAEEKTELVSVIEPQPQPQAQAQMQMAEPMAETPSGQTAQDEPAQTQAQAEAPAAEAPPVSESSSNTAPRFIAVKVSWDATGIFLRIFDNKTLKYLDESLHKMTTEPNLGQSLDIDGVKAVYVGNQNFVNQGPDLVTPPPPSIPAQTQAQSPTPKTLVPSPTPDGEGRINNVPKETPLRRAIIVGLRENLYAGNRRKAEANPNQIEFTFRHFYAEPDNGVALVQVEKVTGNNLQLKPLPMLCILKKEGHGLWRVQVCISLPLITPELRAKILSTGVNPAFLDAN
jgi:hypothetical protein